MNKPLLQHRALILPIKGVFVDTNFLKKDGEGKENKKTKDAAHLTCLILNS